MTELEMSRENRARKAAAMLRGLDLALNDNDIGLEDIHMYVTALSRQLGNDDFTGNHYFAREVITPTGQMAHVRQNLAAIGLRLPLRFPSDEVFMTITEQPDYMPAAVDLLDRITEGHEGCQLPVRDVIFSQKKVQGVGHQHCMKLEATRFVLGTDMDMTERDMYARVYGDSYIAFRRAAADELYERKIIDGTVHAMAHAALTGSLS